MFGGAQCLARGQGQTVVHDRQVQPPPPARNPQRQTVSAAANAQSDSAPNAEAAPELTPEAEYKKALTALVAPVRGYAVSTEDAQRLRDAMKAVGAGDIARARTLRGQLADPEGRKLVEWFALRNGFGTPADFTPSARQTRPGPIASCCGGARRNKRSCRAAAR